MTIQRRSVRARLLAFAASLSITPAAASSAGPAPDHVIPLSQHILPNGVPIYGFPVRIGSRTLETGLDTGSLGLRVLPGPLRVPGDATDTGRPDRYGYGSGIEIDGTIGRADIGVGDVAHAANFQLIQTVRCAHDGRCPYDKVEPKSAYRLQGEGFPNQGLEAIAGVRLATPPRSPTVVNLFAGLGAQTYLIDLPRRGQRTPGFLALDPKPAALSGFVLLPDAHAAHPDARIGQGTVPGCIENVTSGTKICGPVLFDTGAPGVAVHTVRPVLPWARGAQIRLTLTDAAHTKVLAEENFTDATAPETTVRFPKRHLEEGPPHIAAGTVPFLGFSVLYDLKRPGISVRPRPTGVDGVSARIP